MADRIALGRPRPAPCPVAGEPGVKAAVPIRGYMQHPARAQGTAARLQWRRRVRAPANTLPLAPDRQGEAAARNGQAFDYAFGRNQQLEDDQP